MVRQNVMPYKLKRTDEKITARSGLALFAEFFEAMGVGQFRQRILLQRCHRVSGRTIASVVHSGG